jgi:hypothetical protein
MKMFSPIFRARFMLVAVFAIVVCGMTPHAARAASLSLTTSSVAVMLGDTVTISVLVDPEGAPVTAVAGKVQFPGGMRPVALRTHDSVVGAWVVLPSLKNIQNSNALSFSGIMPGGFSGVISPYWKGAHAGTIVTITAQAIQEGDASITLSPDSKVLTNDGKTDGDVGIAGTDGVSGNAKNEIHFNVRAKGAHDPVLIPYLGSKEQLNDHTPPEPFTPLVSTSTSIFNGAYFLVMNANDLQTSIDYYEMGEYSTYSKTASGVAFVRAESPYKLIDQSRRSYIYVKAVDVAGNERLEILPPAPAPHSLFGAHSALGAWGLGILVVLLGIFATLTYRRKSFSP